MSKNLSFYLHFQQYLATLHTKMISFDDALRIKHPQTPQTPDHPYKIILTCGSKKQSHYLI